MEILILGGCCLLFLLTGIILLYKNTQFVKNATKAEGEIVDVSDYISSNSRKRMYSSVIEFRTYNNTAIRFPNPSSSSRKPELGSRINVIYHEENPEKAKVDSVFLLYIIPVILIALGLLLVVITLNVGA